MTKLFSLTLFLFFTQFTTVNAQNISTEELYKSKDFTPLNSFTHGVEGPAVDKYGNVYAVNFDHEGTIGRVTSSGEASVFIELPKGSVGNGTRFDSRGNMLIADYTMHNILKVDMATKNVSVFAHEAKMTQPNDIAIDSKDRIYASDPDFKANKGRIWRIDTDGSVILLDSLDGAANGIEVSPDEKKLYVCAGRKLWAYKLLRGKISDKHLLIEFPDFGSDGMRCDIKGNIYLARFGKGTVVKVSHKGKILREISLAGKRPTNVAFGGEDGRTVYVTLMDNGNLESFRVDAPGRAWKMQKRNP
ncbi:MAG TPA: SMP-30/gluconolactonase/LRE family protein [Hanamia sp.]|nr:SMP-30/gluconolactonase/LRE family protein [Hanamia sp.]